MTQAPICLPYFSGQGHTRVLAEAIATGIITTGIGAARLIDITGIGPEDWAALDAAPTIVFGTPTYMGSSAAAYDMFLEEASSRWDTQLWQDKMAAGFTVATHPSGDKVQALQRLMTYAMQMGMVWVGQTTIGAPVFPDKIGLNRDGSFSGLMATSSRDKSLLIDGHDRETARLFGIRIAAATARWQAGPSSA